MQVIFRFPGVFLGVCVLGWVEGVTNPKTDSTAGGSISMHVQMFMYFKKIKRCIMYKLYVEMKQFKAVLIDNISLTKIIFPIE